MNQNSVQTKRRTQEHRRKNMGFGFSLCENVKGFTGFWTPKQNCLKHDSCSQTLWYPVAFLNYFYHAPPPSLRKKKYYPYTRCPPIFQVIKCFVVMYPYVLTIVEQCLFYFEFQSDKKCLQWHSKKDQSSCTTDHPTTSLHFSAVSQTRRST